MFFAWHNVHRCMQMKKQARKMDNFSTPAWSLQSFYQLTRITKKYKKCSSNYASFPRSLPSARTYISESVIWSKQLLCQIPRLLFIHDTLREKKIYNIWSFIYSVFFFFHLQIYLEDSKIQNTNQRAMRQCCFIYQIPNFSWQLRAQNVFICTECKKKKYIYQNHK